MLKDGNTFSPKKGEMIQRIQWCLIFILYQLSPLEMFLWELIEYWSHGNKICIRKGTPRDVHVAMLTCGKGGGIKTDHF